MNNVKIVRTDGSADESFEGVIGFNAGTTAIQLAPFTGVSTVLVLDADNIRRVEMTPIEDDNVGEQSEEFQAWYKKQTESAEANAKEEAIASLNEQAKALSH